jgi:hypothetical protein
MIKQHCPECGKDTNHYIGQDHSDEGFFEECWICEECGNEDFDVYCE